MGLGLLVLETVLNVLALGLAPAALIQPLGTLSLVAVVLLGVREGRAHQLTRRVVAGIALTVVSVALFVGLSSPWSTPPEAAPTQILHLAFLLVSFSVLGCAVAVGPLGHRVRIVCAGVVFGAVAASAHVLAHVGRLAALRRITERVGHDSAYVFPGFFISLFAFIVLVPLFAFSVGTIVICVRALLLPLTLLLSRAFAQLSRTRLRLWGVPLAAPGYRPRQPGVFGWVKSVADPRSWLDLVFETLIAFPLRTVTFVIAVTWWAGALRGLTYLAWGVFHPAEDTGLLELIVSALTGDALTLAPGLVFLLEVVGRFVIGLVLLLTLPWIMRGLAHLDAVVTTAALGTSVFESGAATVADTTPRGGTPAEAASPSAPG